MQGQTHRSKRSKLKTLFSKIFRSNQPIVPDSRRLSPNDTGRLPDTPDSTASKTTSGMTGYREIVNQGTGAQSERVIDHLGRLELFPDTTGAVTGGSLFPSAHDFVISNSPIVLQNFTQGDRDIVTQVMKALSERVIEGAEYDSSLRDPPPQCHPGTRVQLSRRINTWFRNKEREKALLWLNGPAGVGKSAVIQTFAETLAESGSLGAALFFSRLNDRTDPQRVIATVAFQLATRIPTYRTYITEQIAIDPSLLKKDIKEQFRTFITRPFGNKGIGNGEGPWALLLDGLDECDGGDEQCKIVQLVSEFTLNFPNAPLVWVISSRPEPHIVAMFTNKIVAPSHWSEYMPINSTEACQDVERYLNTSFKAMRERYSYLPSNWPSETQFLKLANGALGLFVFARTAVRFIEDPNHADPASRLNILLSVIDRLDVQVNDDHPFALLDALYTQVLKPIPPSVWRTTQRILGFVICTQSLVTKDGLSFPLKSRTLMGASIILSLEQSTIYGSLHKLHSVLTIPHPEDAHNSGVSFLHASFGDYLTDQTRSKDFFINRGESVDDLTRSLFKLYLDKPWDTKWVRCPPWPSSESHLSQKLRRDAEAGLYYILSGELRSRRGRGPFKSQEDRSECLDVLSQIDPIEIYEIDGLEGKNATFLNKLWIVFREELESDGLFNSILLRDLQVDLLDYEMNRPACIFCRPPSDNRPSEKKFANSSRTLRIFKDRLQELKRSHPKTPVVIFGRIHEKRIALVQNRVPSDQYFCFLYPY